MITIAVNQGKCLLAAACLLPRNSGEYHHLGKEPLAEGLSCCNLLLHSAYHVLPEASNPKGHGCHNPTISEKCDQGHMV